MPTFGRCVARVVILSLLAACLCLEGCAGLGASGEIRLEGTMRKLPAADGYPLEVYTLRQSAGGKAAHATARGVVFYVQGSDDRSVLEATERLAGAAAMGLDVVMVERRGVSRTGLVSREEARRYASKPVRVADTLAVVQDELARRPRGGPAILVGASEGGDVASAVAAAEDRLTHVVLIGCGGAMTQEEELLATWAELPASLGIRSREDLEGIFARIRAEPDGDAEWYGHPYRRWATYALRRPLDDLVRIRAPILLVHGEADRSVPVASARGVAEAFGRAGLTNLTYKEYAGADHRLTRADGVSLFPRLEVDLVEWLAATGAMPAGEAAVFTSRVRRAHREVF